MDGMHVHIFLLSRHLLNYQVTTQANVGARQVILSALVVGKKILNFADDWKSQVPGLVRAPP